MLYPYNREFDSKVGIVIRNNLCMFAAPSIPRAGIGREKKRGISTILLRRSGSIGAFAADLDNSPPGSSGRGFSRGCARPSRTGLPGAGRRPDHEDDGGGGRPAPSGAPGGADALPSARNAPHEPRDRAYVMKL